MQKHRKLSTKRRTWQHASNLFRIIELQYVRNICSSVGKTNSFEFIFQAYSTKNERLGDE